MLVPESASDGQGSSGRLLVPLERLEIVSPEFVDFPGDSLPNTPQKAESFGAEGNHLASTVVGDGHPLGSSFREKEMRSLSRFVLRGTCVVQP